jgi:hypothetical protein
LKLVLRIAGTPVWAAKRLISRWYQRVLGCGDRLEAGGAVDVGDRRDLGSAVGPHRLH